MTKESLTQERLKEVLDYDRNTGVFTRLLTRGGKKKGDIAGCIWTTRDAKKYLIASIDNRKYQLHRIAWLYTYGKFPNDQIDHINGNGTDNRISNLRDVSNLTNGMNQRKPSNNTSGEVGVMWHKNRNKWHVQICLNGRNKHLGYYFTFIAACYARHQANIKYGFHENHGTERAL